MHIKSRQIEESYEYIIVGAGIVGLTLVRELLEAGKANILVVESGSMLSSDPYPKTKTVKSTKLNIKRKSQYSGVGGGSNVWGSLNGILSKKLIDEAYKEGNFPLSYDQYLNYMSKTVRYGFPDLEEFNTDDISLSGKLRPKKIVQVTPNIRFSNFSTMLEGDDVHFLQENFVEYVESHGKITKIVVRGKGSETLHFIQGKKIVICANTIESFKILKKSKVNLNDRVLGEGFMNHPKGVIGVAKNHKKMKKFLTKQSVNRNTYVGIQMDNTDWQHYVKVNKGFRHPWVHYLSNRLDGASSNHSGGSSGSLRDSVKSYIYLIVQYALIVIDKILKKLYPDYLHFEVFTEVKYHDENKMSYDHEVDKVCVNYTFGEEDIAAVLKLIETIKTKFDLHLEFYPKTTKRLAKLISLDASHHMGGVIAGKDKNKSVLALDLSLHEHNNIFVCGGAIFSFSGVANPTMSYVALAIWLSEKI